MYCNGETLFKLGQIDIPQYEKWLQEKSNACRNAGKVVDLVYSHKREEKAKERLLEKEEEKRYLERIARLNGITDMYEANLYDIPIEPYSAPYHLNFNQQLEHKIDYELKTRLIREENERRKKEREKKKNDPEF